MEVHIPRKSDLPVGRFARSESEKSEMSRGQLNLCQQKPNEPVISTSSQLHIYHLFTILSLGHNNEFL